MHNGSAAARQRDHAGAGNGSLAALVERALEASMSRGSCAGGEAGRENLTDEGNGARYVRLHRDVARYVARWKKWAVWDGRRWDVETGDVLAYQLARGVIDDLVRQRLELEERAAAAGDGAEALEADIKKINSWIKKTENGNRFDTLLRHAVGWKEIALDYRVFDSDPWLLNCRDGTIDLRTGELRPHMPSDMITRVCGCGYEPMMPTPHWDAHLLRVMGGNIGLVEYLRRAIGYTLTGVTSEHVMFILYGGGANGKSTTLEVLRLLLGDYAGVAAPDLLLTGGERHPTELADLYGRRLVYSHEVQDGGRLAESKVKRLTGSDVIKARRMQEDFWEFTPTHKFWLGTNYKPIIRGTDHAIWRRIRLVPFTVRIADDERDPHILDKLKAELPGILAWAVRGCLEWQRCGLQDPPEVVEATRSYRSEMDIFSEFLIEHCVADDSAQTTTKDLYSAFKDWAAAAGEKVIAQHVFGRRLAERGLRAVKTRTGHAAWSGVRLRRAGEPADLSWSGEREERPLANGHGGVVTTAEGEIVWDAVEEVET